jgi:hypothetical protein
MASQLNPAVLLNRKTPFASSLAAAFQTLSAK